MMIFERPLKPLDLPRSHIEIDSSEGGLSGKSGKMCRYVSCGPGARALSAKGTWKSLRGLEGDRNEL